MTTQEHRNELTNQLMSKLLKTMTELEGDKALNRYEQLAWNILRKHRGISINRNEVRRRIDDMKEKFTVDNLKEYAEQLEQFCNAVIRNDLCIKHYEVDVQWSLISFLLDIAYNPTVALRKHPPKLIFENAEIGNNENSADLEEIEIKDILKENFIPVTNYKDDGSDLSDWSEDERTEDGQVTETKAVPNVCQNLVNVKPVQLLPTLPPLKPPVREAAFSLKTVLPNIKQQIEDNVQSSCWLTETVHRFEESDILHDAANFAILLKKFDNFKVTSIVTDFCFLRELLWMFYAPQSCQAFVVTAEHQIRMKPGVTLSSVSAPTLASFLECQILPYANELNTLRNFIDAVYAFQKQRLPKTYDFYAANLKSLLDPITLKIVNFEDRVASQRDFELNTLIQFKNTFHEIFKNIEIVHTIHKNVTLNSEKFPAHIVSSYLLAALIKFSNSASNSLESNLAASLFLTSINAFCSIIDNWWNEGRLDDWQGEFVVEYDSNHEISQRMYVRNKAKAFFVPKYVSDVICESKFIRLLLMHSLEVGHTLNLLYEISRIGDLRKDCKAIDCNIYDAFIEDVLDQVRKLGVKTERIVLVETNEDVVDRLQPQHSIGNNYSNGGIHLTTDDEFLLMLFGGSNDHRNDIVDATKAIKEKTALDIFEELSKYQQILPFEEIILNSFTKILRERIALANMFVVKLYREDFKILTHLRNVRKVLLLEADDLMMQFYGKLFKQIEAGKPWANAFVLTMQLDDILSIKFPEMSTLFRFEVNTESCTTTNKVVDALESLTINYNLGNELLKIISADDMKIYNRIFRFLLKIKWGLMILENMPFLRTNRPLYGAIDMVQFAMRRLENIRFWIITAIQWITSHLLMLQIICDELDAQMEKCTTVNEMKTVHKSFLTTMSEHCFLTENLKGILIGIEQLLSLVLVIQLDYQACSKQLSKRDPLSLEDSGDVEDLENENYSFTAHIDQVELTYVRCHEYLANLLKNEVYIKQMSFLSGLSAAFNTSMPY